MQLDKYLLEGNFLNIEMANEFYTEIKNESKLKYVWYQQLDKMDIGEVENQKIDFSQLLEARIFNEDEELHIYQYEDRLRVFVKRKEEQDKDKYIEETQILRSKYGKEIKLRHYIGQDDDGQAFIKMTCLCGYTR
ncbi:hypothetical protein EHE19_008700 [Ruminiclostridium herbifermentans]|uniref:Uncharacterized protein n=1 Tax=Ruminiclostridium herbifermentans TaxID=2488810 RepID=A0A4U7JJG2_9FIRM|nr:hypothetical protein [Ruminiclostridium herbifermentans]QNU68459.1 hypothetical protein EHE19_008700 [Ruminiclostridium herbifermentans]